MREWELLFPAEREYYERLFGTARPLRVRGC